MNFKPSLIKIHRALRQFGLDALRFLRAVRGLPAFVRDYLDFRRRYGGRINLNPCLHDRYAEAGVTKSEYFWQDLIVARWIHEANPEHHVDVGSRTDGFVAHVASFRELEVFDVRPINTKIPGVSFRQADMMDASSIRLWQNGNSGGGYCDSLSCLHVLEHFGLGRYGDPIDPTGYKKGFANLVRLLRPGAHFYLSTPIGQERLEFNANWVFDPRTILELASGHGLQLERFSVFNPRTGLLQIDAIEQKASLQALASEHYNLGIFFFTRSMVRADEQS